MLRTVWCLETWKLTHTHSCTYTQSNTQATTEHRMENEQRWNKIQKNRMCFTLRLEALLAVLIWLRDKSTCRLIVSFSLHWSEWTGAFRTMPSEQCQAWASTCGRAVPGCATLCRSCDRSVRVSRYVGQSPGTPSMGTRGGAFGLERKWRIIHWASDTSTEVTLANVQRPPPPSTFRANLSNIRS